MFACTCRRPSRFFTSLPNPPLLWLPPQNHSHLDTHHSVIKAHSPRETMLALDRRPLGIAYGIATEGLHGDRHTALIKTHGDVLHNMHSIQVRRAPMLAESRAENKLWDFCTDATFKSARSFTSAKNRTSSKKSKRAQFIQR